ncbi:hypothetical protein SARC_10943 [Sphaeroforma arctica JP610]|uniref:GATA-type domain-containing protein n=1 Tax=Sphaeroforma arctica JP610 TaxID=667725 RepID=A0A0L0FIH7_9EUKA|nr:hypothetical protein SARC_10943 [Sphaeroforma arctica JP610]KNC76564.1 hypothetical protein SARC_10943 [Sphaeroforma arctica JP610]|eukprot:XP_014150466.1 hypothetical protein SARC_10943 [Sphaeroforma arctica JP610]
MMARKGRPSKILFIDYYSNKRAKHRRNSKTSSRTASLMSEASVMRSKQNNVVQTNLSTQQQYGIPITSVQESPAQWKPSSESLHALNTKQHGSLNPSCEGVSSATSNPSLISNLNVPLSFTFGSDQSPPLTSGILDDIAFQYARFSLYMGATQPFNPYGLLDQAFMTNETNSMVDHNNYVDMRTLSTIPTTDSLGTLTSMIADIEPFNHIRMSDILSTQTPVEFFGDADLKSLGNTMKLDLDGFSCDSFLSLSDTVGLGSAVRVNGGLSMLDSGTSMIGSTTPISYCSSDLFYFGSPETGTASETSTYFKDMKVEHKARKSLTSEVPADVVPDFENNVTALQSSSLPMADSELTTDSFFAVHKPGTIVCFNCKIFNEKTWRKSPNGDTLCNACGLYEKAKGKPRPRHLAHRKLKRLLNREAKHTKLN